MKSIENIRRERAHLLASAEQQRHSLGAALSGTRQRLSVLERGLHWMNWLRARPYLAAVPVALLVALATRRRGKAEVPRPRPIEAAPRARATDWAARGLAAWRTWRTLRETLVMLATRVPPR
jgi:hypothetical protein